MVAPASLGLGCLLPHLPVIYPLPNTHHPPLFIYLCRQLVNLGKKEETAKKGPFQCLCVGPVYAGRGVHVGRAASLDQSTCHDPISCSHIYIHTHIAAQHRVTCHPSHTGQYYTYLPSLFIKLIKQTIITI